MLCVIGIIRIVYATKINKLKSLKVAQSKDDYDGGVGVEDACMNGCENDASV